MDGFVSQTYWYNDVFRTPQVIQNTAKNFSIRNRQTYLHNIRKFMQNDSLEI